MIMTYKTIFTYQVLYDLWMYNYKNAKNRDYNILFSIMKPSLRLHLDCKAIDGDKHSQ